ncbi:tyrosine-type recombinase/integrase [Aliarcobacter butzleri]|uniref:tyrosine-type recombinase/integrase n=1 Tax=Aliarcobacter butzleri TaxID=28197 RepID=UPI00214CCCA7|nr:site-specific integrase [Aliarcobacter butzleri]MCP3650110.1 site-specific integrase [Arcobacter sp. DNRA7]MCR1816283.1 site-specific integrase [Aliarcobacter butzleri]MDN5067969.1 site-specific integrase [Aliarcobacter butzleri]UXC30122.1 site-specific integrase [Aliarcobacter butzleri]
MEFKTLPKKISTNEEGIFYKTIINENGKEIDKTFIIRYRENNVDKSKTIGKYSQGIRINYCKQIRNEILMKLRLGEEPPTIAKKKKKIITTLDNLAEIYFKEKEMEVKDLEKIKRSYINHIKPFLGHKDADEITSDDIKEIQKYKRKFLAERTINAIIQIVGAIYNVAIQKEIFKGNNPVNKNIKRVNVDNKRERYLTLEEIYLLLNEVKHEEYLYIFVQLALQTGGRMGTILSITKKDIKLESNSIQLKDHKNNSTYLGFFNNELKYLLEKRMENLNTNDLIIDRGRQVIQDRLTKIYNKYFNVGLKNDDRKNRVVTHTLRHTFASHLAIKGTPIYTIQKLMNHKDITMTLRYAKLAPDSGKKMVLELYKLNKKF